MGAPHGHARQRPGFVRRVDDAVLPLLDRLASRLGHLLGTPFRAATRREEAVLDGRLARSLWRHRQELLLAAAVLAFAGSYLHFERYPDLRRTVVTEPAGSDATAPSDASGATRAVTAVVGPSSGTDIDRYVAERHAALQAADGGTRRLAVVSLDAYATADDLAAILPAGVAAYEVLARAPGRDLPVDVVPVDGPLAETVHEAVRDARRRIAAEEQELRARLEAEAATEAGVSDATLAEVDRLAATRNLLDAGAGIAYAVLVEAPVATLRQLADHEAVRLVDLAPAGAEPERVEAVGLLPDASSTVTAP